MVINTDTMRRGELDRQPTGGARHMSDRWVHRDGGGRLKKGHPDAILPVTVNYQEKT